MEFARATVLTSVSYITPVLVARSLGDEVSKTRFPDFAVERGRVQCRIGKTGLAQQVELLSAQFLAAQLGRINRVRVDQ